MRLKDLQNRFSDYIADLKLQNSGDDEFNGQFVNDAIPIETRLNIYQDGVYSTCVSVLMNNHPLLKDLVGDDFLRYMAIEFAKNNLPTSGYLNEYGLNFPDFIYKFKPAAGLPYLYDIARIDRGWNHAYHADDVPHLDPQSLHDVSPADYAFLKMTMHPSVTFVKSDYPIWQIYQYILKNRGGDDTQLRSEITPNAAKDPDALPEKAEEQDNTSDIPPPDMNTGGENVVILRDNLMVKVYPLDEDNFQFLVNLRDKKTIGEASGKVMAKFPAFNLAKTFRGELKRNIFSGFQLSK